MTEKQQLETLLEDWLLGKLSPQDKALLEERIANDADIAIMANESRLAFEVIKAHQHQLLRQKLQQLDEEDTKRQGFLSMPVSLFLVIFLFGIVSLTVHGLIHRNSTLADRFLERDPDYALMSSVGSQQEWNDALDAFDSKNYDAAIHAFQACMEKTNPDFFNMVQWNILMAQLAKDGVTEGWKTGMYHFLQRSDPAYQTSAKKLLEKLDSRWYMIFFSPAKKPLESLKPRLI